MHLFSPMTGNWIRGEGVGGGGGGGGEREFSRHYFMINLQESFTAELGFKSL